MLTHTALESILAAIPKLTVGVVGDLFLDRYLDIDARLTEPSLETGLDAYQVVRVRSSPGAAGTVINNLAALGVKAIHPVAIIGDDGEGHELRAALRALGCVKEEGVVSWPGRRTPTYTKPMLGAPGSAPRELNRLDIKNRVPLPREAEDRLIQILDGLWPRLDALVVLDQVSEPECGVITTRVRDHLTRLGRSDPERVILADSREGIALFRDMWLKPNRRECARACGDADPRAGARLLARKCGRPVFCTFGEEGILVVDARSAPPFENLVPAVGVTKPVDPVGAGDSVSAALACALAGRSTLEIAAAFANLVASITIEQIGTTGTASPDQVRTRWRQTSL